MGKKIMSKMKGKICLFCMVILLCAFIVRVYYVNQNLDLPVTKEYDLGSEVPYERDYMNYSLECIEGYTAKVLGYEILTREELYARCNQDIEDDGHEGEADKIFYLLVNVCFENESFEQVGEAGINLYKTPLVCVNELTNLSHQAFSALNPDMPGVAFSLRKGTSKEVTLTYRIRSDLFKSKEQIDNAGFKLQITEYPTRKFLKLK